MMWHQNTFNRNILKHVFCTSASAVNYKQNVKNNNNKIKLAIRLTKRCCPVQLSVRSSMALRELGLKAGRPKYLPYTGPFRILCLKTTSKCVTKKKKNGFDDLCTQKMRTRCDISGKWILLLSFLSDVCGVGILSNGPRFYLYVMLENQNWNKEIKRIVFHK